MKPLKINHNKPCPDCNALMETKEYQDGGFIDRCPVCGFSGLGVLPKCSQEDSKMMIVGIIDTDKKESVTNFALNLQPLMNKIYDGVGKTGSGGKAVKLTKDEERTILNFYLAVCNYL